jgi:predicted DNA-binding protein (UPF0251 family)
LEDAVRLGLDEWEALRLKDYMGLEQNDCARYMNLTQSTFQRILTAARLKLARVVVEGKPLSIEGGNYEVTNRWLCSKCGYELEHYGEPDEKNITRCPSCGLEGVEKEVCGSCWGQTGCQGHGGGRRRRRGR